MARTVALFCARAGMKTVLFERGSLCREASGVNAGTLTMQMTRVALIPYALRAHAMWASARDWLGHDVGVVVCDGLSLAFTEGEEELLSLPRRQAPRGGRADRADLGRGARGGRAGARARASCSPGIAGSTATPTPI